MYDELKQKIIEMGYPNGRALRSKPYKKFLSRLKAATPFLDDVYESVKPATRCFVILYDYDYVPKCSACGEYTTIGTHKEKVDHYYKNGFRQFCSRKCTSIGTLEKRKKTSFEKYGTEFAQQADVVKDKVKNTNLERYGSESYVASKEFQEKYSKEYEQKTGYKHHFANPDVIAKREEENQKKYGMKNAFQFSRDKIEQSMMENWGVTNPLQNDEIKERVFATNIKVYGFRNPMKNKSVLEKTHRTNKKRYGHKYATRAHYSDKANEILYSKEKLEAFYDEIGNTEHMAKELGIGSSRTILQAIREHGIEVKQHEDKRRSQGERQICRFLDENEIAYEISDRSLVAPKEIDIVIPEYKIAIEFNGVYYHSDAFKDKYYHQKKSIECMENEYLLIHVYEDQWIYKKELIKTKILQKCGITDQEKVYGRKCVIGVVNGSVARKFYNENHIQGYNDSKLNYGLWNDGQLVACMSFKMKQGRDKGHFDLVRYATSKNVVGGFSKLLKHFQRNNEWHTIETFASLDYSHGDVYFKNGFEKVGITEPNYYYFKGYDRYSRNAFMKHKLEEKLERYDPQLSESENMNMHGFTKLYDSGSIKFKLEK